MYAANNPVYFEEKNGEFPLPSGWKKFARAGLDYLASKTDNKVVQFAVGWVGAGVESVPDAQTDGEDWAARKGTGIAQAVNGDYAEAATTLNVGGRGDATAAAELGKKVAEGDMRATGQAVRIGAETAASVIGPKIMPKATKTSISTQVVKEAKRVNPNVNTKTLTPGPYADKSITARSRSQKFTTAERQQINEIGQTTGCHTCGSTSSGRASGNFTPDHQPPSSLIPPPVSQELYPHCASCSSSQGGTTGGLIRKGYDPNNINY